VKKKILAVRGLRVEGREKGHAVPQTNQGDAKKGKKPTKKICPGVELQKGKPGCPSEEFLDLWEKQKTWNAVCEKCEDADRSRNPEHRNKRNHRPEENQRERAVTIHLIKMHCRHKRRQNEEARETRKNLFKKKKKRKGSRDSVAKKKALRSSEKNDWLQGSRQDEQGEKKG